MTVNAATVTTKTLRTKPNADLTLPLYQTRWKEANGFLLQLQPSTSTLH